MKTCPHCDRPVEGYGPQCPTCDGFIGYPNVDEVEEPDERSALEQRYHDALEDASNEGADAVVADFKQAVDNAQAVINLSPRDLAFFLTSDSRYEAYRKLIETGRRARADRKNDKHRSAVDGILFGTYDKDICTAALSINGEGLISYGSFAARFKEATIGHRASLLEENSFDFVKHHNCRPGEPLPQGYRATWNERGKLAVAKLGATISPTTNPAEFPRILLWTEGNRETDRFIEVHIYGSFDRFAVHSVCGTSKGLSRQDQAWLSAIQDVLINQKSIWVEL